MELIKYITMQRHRNCIQLYETAYNLLFLPWYYEKLKFKHLILEMQYMLLVFIIKYIVSFRRYHSHEKKCSWPDNVHDCCKFIINNVIIHTFFHCHCTNSGWSPPSSSVYGPVIYNTMSTKQYNFLQLNYSKIIIMKVPFKILHLLHCF